MVEYERNPSGCRRLGSSTVAVAAAAAAASVDANPKKFSEDGHHQGHEASSQNCVAIGVVIVEDEFYACGHIGAGIQDKEE